MSRWLVMDIGCIECECASIVVAVVETESEADAIAEACEQDHHWRGGGQNHFESFELPDGRFIDPEFAESARRAQQEKTT